MNEWEIFLSIRFLCQVPFWALNYISCIYILKVINLFYSILSEWSILFSFKGTIQINEWSILVSFNTHTHTHTHTNKWILPLSHFKSISLFSQGQKWIWVNIIYIKIILNLKLQNKDNSNFISSWYSFETNFESLMHAIN